MPIGLGGILVGADANFSPINYPNLFLWLPGGINNFEVGSYASQPNSVLTWYDASGNSRNAVPFAENNNAPGIGSEGVSLNGFNCPNWAYPNDYSQTALAVPNGGLSTAYPYSTWATFTIFAVLQVTQNPPTQTYARVMETSYEQGFYLGTNSNTAGMQLIVNDSSIGNCSDNGLPTNTTFLVTATYDGTTGRLFRNGVQTASQAFPAPNSATNSNIAIGQANVSIGTINPWIGVMGDLALYTDAKSGTALSQLNSYFMAKYGI